MRHSRANSADMALSMIVKGPWLNFETIRDRVGRELEHRLHTLYIRDELAQTLQIKDTNAAVAFP
jgi:hypothetical protein